MRVLIITIRSNDDQFANVFASPVAACTCTSLTVSQDFASLPAESENFKAGIVGQTDLYDAWPVRIRIKAMAG